MLFLFIAFGYGFVSGLRSMTGFAAVSVAARAGWLTLGSTWLAFLGYSWTPWILVVAAVAELVNDKLPNTPSRKTPPQFAVRIVAGGLCGLAIGFSSGWVFWGVTCGIFGAVAGTYGGAAARSALVKAIGGRDLPIALSEDAVAVTLATLLTLCL
jgi:uncharacterized membrane protein